LTDTVTKNETFLNFLLLEKISPAMKKERHLITIPTLPRMWGSSDSESFTGFRLSASLRPE
jgi:hypothetical protein